MFLLLANFKNSINISETKEEKITWKLSFQFPLDFFVLNSIEHHKKMGVKNIIKRMIHGKCNLLSVRMLASVFHFFF